MTQVGQESVLLNPQGVDPGAFDCIFLMGWRIMVRLLDNYNPGNLCGFIGAVLFVCSDFMIGVDKFRYPVKDASLRIMLTYYLGQLGIALSACYNPQRVDARNLNGKVD